MCWSEEMKILLLGGSGSLGKELITEFSKRNIEFIAPRKSECDIRDKFAIENFVKGVDIVIHSAGFVDLLQSEKYPDDCIDVNVLGTANVVKLCRLFQKRLVYISTDKRE